MVARAGPVSPPAQSWQRGRTRGAHTDGAQEGAGRLELAVELAEKLHCTYWKFVVGLRGDSRAVVCQAHSALLMFRFSAQIQDVFVESFSGWTGQRGSWSGACPQQQKSASCQGAAPPTGAMQAFGRATLTKGLGARWGVAESYDMQQ